MSFTPISIDIQEWTHKDPTEAGSSLAGLFLEEDGDVKKSSEGALRIGNA